MGKGIKYDTGKPRWDLVPFREFEEVVKVLTHGARKYSDDNWKSVEPFRKRYSAAAFRHLVARMKGEITDPESGLSHLAEARCCIL